MKPKLFLICTGLGRIERGFETYIDSLAYRLNLEFDTIQLTVFAGGNLKNVFYPWKRIINISRGNKFVKYFLKNESILFEIEQASFFIMLLPYLFFKRPNVIYLGEYKLYCYLFKIRNLFGLNYKLVLYTGGQVTPGLFNKKMDYIHHVTDVYYLKSLKDNIPAERQYVIPHFITDDFIYDKDLAKSIKLKSLNKKIVLSVGYIDIKVKRMDLFVRLLSDLPLSIFPIILGEYSKDTTVIETLLTNKFGKNGYILNKISHSELGTFYSISDLYLSCSPMESFGLANVEALFFGKPVIVNDFYESRYVLKNFALFMDVGNEINTKRMITEILSVDLYGYSTKCKEFVRKNYTWEYLSTSYLSMFRDIINSKY